MHLQVAVPESLLVSPPPHLVLPAQVPAQPWICSATEQHSHSINNTVPDKRSPLPPLPPRHLCSLLPSDNREAELTAQGVPSEA